MSFTRTIIQYRNCVSFLRGAGTHRQEVFNTLCVRVKDNNVQDRLYALFLYTSRDVKRNFNKTKKTIKKKIQSTLEILDNSNK